MSTEEDLVRLIKTHRKIDEEISRLEMTYADTFRIQELKRRKLYYKDQIEKFNEKIKRL